MGYPCQGGRSEGGRRLAFLWLHDKFRPRGPPLGEIPYALAKINFEIAKSEAC